MSKPITGIHATIMRYANEAGFFPFRSHLSRINIESTAISKEMPNADYRTRVIVACERMYADAADAKAKPHPKQKCMACGRLMTWAEQRRQYGRLKHFPPTADRIKEFLPRCQKCVTKLIERICLDEMG